MTAGVLPVRGAGTSSPVPMGRWGEASELAAAVAFLLSPEPGSSPASRCPWTGAHPGHDGAVPHYAARLLERETQGRS